MKLAIKEILKDHFEQTNEYITQKMLADEMTKAGIFKNVHSAQNMLQYNITGKAKSLDIEIINFLCARFKKNINEIINHD
jgi:hypothetical protein